MIDEKTRIRDLIECYLEKGGCRSYLIEGMTNKEKGCWNNHEPFTAAEVEAEIASMIADKVLIDCPPPDGPDWLVAKSMQPGDFAHNYGLKKWGSIFEKGDVITLIDGDFTEKVKVTDIEYDVETKIFDDEYNTFFLEQYDSVLPENQNDKLARLIREDEEEKAMYAAMKASQDKWDASFDEMDKKVRLRANELGHNVVYGPGAFGHCVKCNARVEYNTKNFTFDGGAVSRKCR